jgi:hypothetical protein
VDRRLPPVCAMKTARCEMSGVLAVVGCIVAAVTLLLFYELCDPSARSETFTFTVWFVVFQEALFFGSLALIGFRWDDASTAAPVRIGYLTSVVLYNLLGLATVVLFNLALLPQHARPKTYYTVAVAETGLWVALAVILRVVSITRRTSHREAETSRSGVDRMLVTCDRIRALGESHGWRLAAPLHELAERIRFSEGLRRNRSLLDEVSRRLDQLEVVASGAGDESAEKTAERLVRELSIMATRRG